MEEVSIRFILPKTNTYIMIITCSYCYLICLKVLETQCKSGPAKTRLAGLVLLPLLINKAIQLFWFRVAALMRFQCSYCNYQKPDTLCGLHY